MGVRLFVSKTCIETYRLSHRNIPTFDPLLGMFRSITRHVKAAYSVSTVSCHETNSLIT